MAERSSAQYNSIERDFHEAPNMYRNLNSIRLSVNILNDQKCRLKKINEIKDEIRERESMSKNHSN